MRSLLRSPAGLAIVVLTSLLSSSIHADDDADEWLDLSSQVNLQEHVIAGNWSRTTRGLATDAAPSSRLMLPFQPKSEYDFRVSFTRNTGIHSVSLMFVVGTGQASFEIDAWRQHLAGIQMIGGRTIRDNATRTTGQTIVNGRTYTAMVQVRRGRVQAYLDNKLLVDYKTDGSDLSLPDLWRLHNESSLAIGAYDSATSFHSIEVRTISEGAPLMVAATSAKSSATLPGSTSQPPSTASRSQPKANSSRDTRPRVLMVIANQDFYYREYHDPREQLERAGIQVEVAAGRRQTCRPHANSGQRDSGEVIPDLAVADADAWRYDAIVLSGGWGSSMYQYAFPGSYANPAYNGNPQTKAAVNSLLNEFITQDKYVGALCHGVSVLAWARVDGKSILAGKRAVGSPRQSPAGIYNGQRGQPLSRWNAEVNGARLSPALSIGNPRTSADDVIVDGKIITGEDDNSSALFGATLARLLTARSP